MQMWRINELTCSTELQGKVKKIYQLSSRVVDYVFNYVHHLQVSVANILYMGVTLYMRHAPWIHYSQDIFDIRICLINQLVNDNIQILLKSKLHFLVSKKNKTLKKK